MEAPEGLYVENLWSLFWLKSIQCIGYLPWMLQPEFWLFKEWNDANVVELSCLCRHEPDAIFVRSVNEAEVKPKPKAYAAAP